MEPRRDSTHAREIELELLAQPAFAGGTLQFVKQVCANHSQLSEYTFQSDNGLKSLVVKEQASGAESGRATLQEFENLRKARTLLGLALGRSVPEPLLALPERGILVTSKVPGVPFTVILKKYANRLAGPFCTSTLTETARRVGSWLRRFQEATDAEPFPYSTVSYLSELEGRLSRFREKGFESSMTEEILRQASLQSAPLNGRLIPAAARHGDFIAQNILIEPDGIAVVDFEGFSEREAAYDDLGMFLGYMLVLEARAPYSPRALRAARRGFLAGFLAGNAIDHALLNTYILKGAVRIIADGPSPTSYWDRLDTWMLARRIKHLVSGESKFEDC